MELVEFLTEHNKLVSKLFRDQNVINKNNSDDFEKIKSVLEEFCKILEEQGEEINNLNERLTKLES